MENNNGEFSGYPLTRWCSKDNRVMILKEPFYYIDSNEKKWEAPIGAYLNGATIPKILWTVVGPPFVGPYRRASVVHDYHVGEGCNQNVTFKERRDADRMFFKACITDHCSLKLATILYIGVSIGSWASRIGLKHSIENSEFQLTSDDNDLKIRNKYDDIKAKADGILNSDEDFNLLEALVNAEINK